MSRDVGDGNSGNTFYLNHDTTIFTDTFDDSLYAIRTARSAGFQCVAVVDGTEPPEVRAELEELALFCVSDFRDLLDKLEGPNP